MRCPANPSPKLMEIQTTSEAPAMLLLNDKIEPEWHAYIDGKQAPVPGFAGLVAVGR